MLAGFSHNGKKHRARRANKVPKGKEKIGERKKDEIQQIQKSRGRGASRHDRTRGWKGWPVVKKGNHKFEHPRDGSWRGRGNQLIRRSWHLVLSPRFGEKVLGQNSDAGVMAARKVWETKQ